MKNSAFSLIAACLLCNTYIVAQAPDTVWSRTYNGPANLNDYAAGCAVDGSGNLYVTGGSRNNQPSHRHDIVTIKYNPATGDTIWTARYNGATSRDDEAAACAVDASGNLYVAGYTDNGTFAIQDDFILIKYNPATGVPIWTRTFNGFSGGYEKANGCATDGSNFVYVTGYSSNGTNKDILTIKYTSNGDTVWTRRYNGPANGDDQAYSCAVDISGNLYVTGYSHNGSQLVLLTIKYNSAGDTVWTRRSTDAIDQLDYVFTGCAVDGSGNVFVTGMCGVQSGSGNRYGVTIKYSPSGQTLWTSRFDGPTTFDQTIRCAVDVRGDLYVCGSSDNGPNDDDWRIIKYNSTDGSVLWTLLFNGAANGADYAIDCAVDNSGYLYVVGATNFGTVGDYLVNKYQSTVTTVEQIDDGIPDGFILSQNYPNPFNPSTSIEISLPQASFVVLNIVNVLGEEVATLVSQNLSAGTYNVVWNAHGASSGVYFYRLRAGAFIQTKKLVLLR